MDVSNNNWHWFTQFYKTDRWNLCVRLPIGQSALSILLCGCRGQADNGLCAVSAHTQARSRQVPCLCGCLLDIGSPALNTQDTALGRRTNKYLSPHGLYLRRCFQTFIEASEIECRLSRYFTIWYHQYDTGNDQRSKQPNINFRDRSRMPIMDNSWTIGPFMEKET